MIKNKLTPFNDESIFPEKYDISEADQKSMRFYDELLKYFNIYTHASFWDDQVEELEMNNVLCEHKEAWHKVLKDFGFYDDTDPDDFYYDEDGFMAYVQEYVLLSGPESDQYNFGIELIACLDRYLGAYIT